MTDTTKTPISLDIAPPAMSVLAAMSQSGEELNGFVTYYIDRIGDGYFEKFMEKSEPLVNDDGWMSEHIRVLPTRMVIVAPDGTPQMLTLVTAVQPQSGETVTVTIISLDFVAVPFSEE